MKSDSGGNQTREVTMAKKKPLIDRSFLIFHAGVIAMLAGFITAILSLPVPTMLYTDSPLWVGISVTAVGTAAAWAAAWEYV